MGSRVIDISDMYLILVFGISKVSDVYARDRSGSLLKRIETVHCAVSWPHVFCVGI